MLNQPTPPAQTPPGSVLQLPSERMFPPLYRSSDARDGNFIQIGLTGLRASGSGQFDREQLYMLQYALRGRDVHVIDLRAEPHGMVNRAAITWDANEEFASISKVQSAEMRWLNQLMLQRSGTVAFFATGSFADRSSWQPLNGLVFDVRTTATPARTVAEARFTYHRILFPDGRLPDDALVDRLVRMMNRLPDGAWRHFHCDTGGYRTSLCFTMWDMMQNFSSLNADAIISRQRALGGVDLTKTPEARAFLSQFYQYCLTSGPEFKLRWSTWKNSND